MAAALLSAGALAAPAPALAAGCTGGHGVTVVVDFGPYGGVQTGCAPNPSSGLSALTQAGFGVTMVTTAPGFLCRIDGLPPVEDDACVRPAPETAYWSYWQSPPGGRSWTYSTLGVTSSNPADGGTEGFAFGAGAQPGIAPPPNTAAPPPPPPPPPAATRTSAVPPPSASPAPPPGTSRGPAPPAAGGATTAGPDGAGGAGPAATTGPGAPDSSSAPTSAAPSGAGGSPTGGPSAAGTTTAAGEASTSPGEVATAADSRPVTDRGAPWGLLAAGVLAAALAGGAYWQIRQRR